MSWPKLSEALAGPAAPDRCRACGSPGWPDAGLPGMVALDRWIECDDADRPTGVVVVLCRECSGRIIEPHPRLYYPLEVNRPWPGAMGLCVECRHRVGVSCPLARFNGGPGVSVRIARAIRAHVCRVPRRLSGWVAIWRTPARECSRREAMPAAGREGGAACGSTT